MRARIGKRQRRSIENVRYNIGSLSSGPMLTSDLLPILVDQLLGQPGLKVDHKRTVKAISRRAQQPGYFDDGGDSEQDLTDLGDIMQEYAPEGFYFGAHPGDAADYGYWLSDHFVADFDGLKVDDLSEVPAEWSGLVLDVNDHGNMTLYLQAGKSRGEVERVVVWEIV